MKFEGQSIAIREQFESLVEQCAEKMDDLKTVETRIRHAHDQYESEKEAIEAEMRMKTEELEKIDKELRKAKVEGTKELFDSQKKSRELMIEYDNLVRRTGDQREKLFKETLSAMEQIVSFQHMINEKLNELDKIVQSQVEEELPSVNQQ